MNIRYQTSGTCSRQINVEIEDNIVKSVEYIGGCNGNLKGIASLVKGMHIEDVIERLKGIKCDDKKTSCPDQLVQCLERYVIDIKETANNKT